MFISVVHKEEEAIRMLSFYDVSQVIVLSDQLIGVRG